MEPIEPGMPPSERIRLFRRRAGLTQEQAAALKGCSVSLWRKWESGDRQVTSLGDWIEIARVLGVRDLYRLTGLPVAELPSDPAEDESVPPIRTALHSYTPRLAGPPDLDRLSRSVEFAWDTWHGSSQRYTRTGPMLPDLIRETRATVAVLDGPERRDGLRVAATMYLLVRAYTKRIGALDLAMVAADRAAAAAEDADDPEFRAAAAWNMAMVLSTKGYTEECVALVRDAIRELEIINDQRAARFALLGAHHLLLAVQLGRLRDEREALDAIDTANRAAEVTGETNFHRLVFGPTNVGVHRAAVALEMSRPAEALRIAERVDVSRAPSVERRYSHYLDLARGYAIQREDLAAVHMLQRANHECAEETRTNLTAKAVIRDLLHRETATTRPDLRPLAASAGVA